MSHTKHLRQLLQTDNLAQFLTEMLEATEQNGQDSLHSDITLQSAAYHGNERQKRSGIISDSFYNQTRARIRYALEGLLEEYKDNGSYIFDNESVAENKSTITGDKNIVIQGINNSTITINKHDNEDKNKNMPHTPKMPKVFISYNHQDKAVALRVKAYLEKQGIEVTIDLKALNASEDIKSFIEKSIKENDVTFSIVSGKSLMSTWVGMETVNTFYAQKYTDKKFIAAFIENSFFKRNFVDETLDKIELEIKDIETTIANRLAKGRNIDDLQNELKRNKDLEYHLPAIVQRLKESLSVDINGENFESGMEQILESIEKMVIADKQDTHNHKLNIVQNAKNIYNIDKIDNANFS